MQWINSKDGYGWLSIILHWLVVIGVILLLVLGFRADMLDDAGDRAGRAAAMAWHVGVGAILWLVVLARVMSSWLQPRPAPVPQAPPLMLLAVATHQLLLIALLIQIISGPLAIWSNARPINVFDIVAIPSPFSERNEGMHEFAELLHAIGRWTIIVLGSVHILAVLKHVFVDKDGVLGRMLSPPKRS